MENLLVKKIPSSFTSISLSLILKSLMSDGLTAVQTNGVMMNINVNEAFRHCKPFFFLLDLTAQRVQ